jgi:hypothetical protein
MSNNLNFIIGKEESISNISEEVPIIRVMRDNDLDRIIEIDRQVLGENRPDYWEKKG